MAARKKIWTPEVVRQRIQASMLAERLLNQALGVVEMSKNQLDAAKFLLERIIPRAEAPKDLNLKGDLNITVVTGTPADARDHR